MNCMIREMVEIPIPNKLKGVLKEHQEEGISFIVRNVHAGHGCVLAHSMGLGKTAQVIVTSGMLLKTGAVKTVIVLAPKSTMLNWEMEFKTWSTKGSLHEDCPTMRYYRVEETAVSKRLDIVQRWSSTGGILFLGYEQYCGFVSSKTAKKVGSSVFRKLLSNPGPDLLICDEGHRIKSVSSKLSRSLAKIRTLKRIILTGTPLQNHLMEYYAMIDFIRPGHFPRVHFEDYFRRPIEAGQSWDATPEAIHLMKERAYILTKDVSSIVLRRDQSILKAALPSKSEYVIFCPLSSFQDKIYTAYRDAVLLKTAHTERLNLLAYIQVLNKVGSHPDLLHAFLQKPERRKQPWVEPVIASYGTSYKKDVAHDSPKLVAFLYLWAAAARDNKKVLVFSQYVETLDYLNRVLKKFSDLVIFRLDGKQSTTSREAAIKGFQAHTSSCVFLISTRAGGVGVNLNTAHIAVLFDVSFNPANDQQAVFRCYRFGLQHPVVIYRLIADGTPESLVYNRSVSKEWMSRKVVDEAAPTRQYVTQTDLKNVLREDARKIEEAPHLAERWAAEKALCLSRDPYMASMAKSMQARGLSIIKVLRHESLLLDDIGESAGTKEEKAYRKYVATRKDPEDASSMNSGYSSDESEYSFEGHGKRDFSSSSSEDSSSNDSELDFDAEIARALQASKEIFEVDKSWREGENEKKSRKDKKEKKKKKKKDKKEKKERQWDLENISEEEQFQMACEMSMNSASNKRKRSSFEEEDELQLALRLSLEESEQQPSDAKKFRNGSLLREGEQLELARQLSLAESARGKPREDEQNFNPSESSEEVQELKDRPIEINSEDSVRGIEVLHLDNKAIDLDDEVVDLDDLFDFE